MLKVGDYVNLTESGITYTILITKIITDIDLRYVKHYYIPIYPLNIKMTWTDYFYLYPELRIEVLYNFNEEYNAII